MQYLYNSWPEFSADVAAATHVLLLSDYDGTLSPIVSRPEDAVLPAGVRDTLAALARRPDFSVGVISGRSLAETRSLVNIDDIYYAGNHGLEIEGPDLSYINPKAQAAGTVIKDLAAWFATELAGIGGVIIQDKGLSLSVHYRLVKEAEEGAVTDTVQRLTAPLVDAGKIRVFTGKKVWEVRPPIDWHKGKAVETIAREITTLIGLKPLLLIYLGDDTTDEDAFRVLRRPRGWSIFIGERDAVSAAEYCLASPAEVAKFLADLAGLRQPDA